MAKRVLALIMAMIICSVLSVQAFAEDEFDGTTPAIGLGALSEEELEALASEVGVECTECSQNNNARHYSAMGHTHHVLEITSQYQWSRFKKVGAELLEPTDKPSTLAVSQQLDIGNEVDVNIEFSDGVVTAAVGFSVTYSSSSTASYSIDLDPGETARIDVYDVFNVKEFDCLTIWTFNGSTWNEYGTGTARQWSHFGFKVVNT